MITVLRSIVALVVGLVFGGTVNMGLILAGPHVIPPPAGVDVSNVESMRASIHLFEPKHFVFPFLAHALGTLVGALLAFVIAERWKQWFALAVGVFFLAGGIAASTMIPAPTWFLALDLLVAYLPMAWLGARIGGRLTGAQS